LRRLLSWDLSQHDRFQLGELRRMQPGVLLVSGRFELLRRLQPRLLLHGICQQLQLLCRRVLQWDCGSFRMFPLFGGCVSALIGIVDLRLLCPWDL
jgi:hypothetical protein